MNREGEGDATGAADTTQAGEEKGSDDARSPRIWVVEHRGAVLTAWIPQAEEAEEPPANGDTEGSSTESGESEVALSDSTQPSVAVDGASGASLVDAPITDTEFEAMVQDALDRVPTQFLEAVENVAFIIEHDPPPGRSLLGLYHGVPLTGRGYYSGAMPDTITIYQNPLVRIYRTRERVAHEVYRTVVHEIGHYFGLDDEELHDLGWG